MVIKYKLYKNKKSMIFTIIAIIILSVFLLTYTVYSIGKDRKSINKRIETMNNYIFSLEKDLPRQLYISGFRIIYIFEKKIIDSGIPINNLNDSFEELFYNGTLYGEPQILMNGVTYSSILNNVNTKAESFNIFINLTNPELKVSQTDPWNVRIDLKVDLFMMDKGNLAIWNKTEYITTFIPIEFFEDPLYVLNTGKRVTNKIRKTIYLPFVNGTDVTNLNLHSQNSMYINSSDSPSFLERLQGKFDANINGIESLVYLPKLSAQGISVDNSKSCIDHIYFSSNNPSSRNIKGMPNWFRIDDDHLEVYNVTGLIV
ncbi:MAG: hypothetical protein QXW97_04255 [Candidatus Pacearchaeota archaeon]